MVSGWGAMACRANERKGWGGVKTCPVRRLDRPVPLAFLNIQKKGDGVGGGLNFGSLRPTKPQVLTRAEFFPPKKVFSKWPESKGAAEAHERTQGAHVLAQEGR